ncbi:hypothetical protein BYT27DRAFT_7339172 [Phlegmacium glaucopus]|nr:hypothetical protein BYT27DRAFT_7339172 [Phlegmacium glaucopus]
MSSSPLLLRFRRLRPFVYFKPTTLTNHPKIRVFRFGIPLLMKTEDRLFSTEADDLRFLNASGLDLPIPHLIDSIAINGEMERPTPSCHAYRVLYRATSLTKFQNPIYAQFAGGLPDPMTFFDSYRGNLSVDVDSDNPWTEEGLVAADVMRAVTADRIM